MYYNSNLKKQTLIGYRTFDNVKKKETEEIKETEETEEIKEIKETENKKVKKKQKKKVTKNDTIKETKK